MFFIQDSSGIMLNNSQALVTTKPRDLVWILSNDRATAAIELLQGLLYVCVYIHIYI